MSVAAELLAEMAVWRAAWRQIETFLDRMDEMRDKDLPHAERVKALLRVFAFIELERKWCDGDGLNLPLEMARPGEGPDDVLENGQLRRARGSDYGESSGVKDQVEQRLPGLFDIEIAAAALILPGDGTETPDDENVKLVRLAEPHTLFERYDADKKDWAAVRLPRTHFPDLKGSVEVDTTERGLFPLESRRSIVFDSLKVDLAPPDDPSARPETHPKLWSAFRDERLANLPVEMGDLQPLLAGSGADTDVAKILLAACQKGAAAARHAQKVIADRGVGPAADVEEEDVIQKLESIETAFASRAVTYQRIAAGQATAMDDQVRSQILHRIWHRAGDLEAVLDESVDAQIAYPDGSLRQLRTLEWTFLMHWSARLPWFWYRRERMLKPLLHRFLRAFRQSVSRLRKHLPTPFPLTLTLNRPAAVGDTTLQIAPRADGLLHDFSKVVPGQLARLHGDRSTLALVLGVDPPLRADGQILQRLRVSPLRVSLATGKDVQGSAGMIGKAAALSPHPVAPSEDEIRAGTSADHPENDGVLAEMVSVWSKLCLLLGTNAVETHSAFGAALPCPLGLTTKIPVIGPVEPAADRLLVRVKDLEKLGFPAKSPHFARPGEMLLLRGRTEDGDLWQTAVEVRGVVRVAEKDAQGDLSVVTLRKPLCCEGPGEILAVLITSTKLPAPLVEDVRLHRHFRGFGAPSLASENILPKVLDPDSATEGEAVSEEDKRVYRGPELETALAILQHWLGDRTAP